VGEVLTKEFVPIEIMRFFNPECYKIVNGRNVLFFKSFYANALTNWEKEIKKTPENTLMNQGDSFWTKTLAQ